MADKAKQSVEHSDDGIEKQADSNTLPVFEDTRRVEDLLDDLLEVVVPSAHAEDMSSTSSIINTYNDIIDDAERMEMLGKKNRFRSIIDSELTSVELEDSKVDLIKNVISSEELAFMAQLEALYGIPKEVLVGIRMCETGRMEYGSPELFSYSGAEGRLQIVAGTAVVAGKGRVIIQLDSSDRVPTSQDPAAKNIPIRFGKRILKTGRLGDYMDTSTNPPTYFPPEDDRLGLRVWPVAINVMLSAFSNSGATWQRMAYLYNGDPSAQDAYSERFLSYARAAKEIYAKNKEMKAPQISAIKIEKDTKLSEIVSGNGLLNIARNTPIGAVNGHLGLFRVPLSELPNLKIPRKYLFNYKTSFIISDDNAFGRQATNETYSINGSYFEVNTKAFKPKSRDEWEREVSNRQPSIGYNPEFGNVYVSGPQYISMSRGKEFPPTVDDLVRAGIPLEVIIQSNPGVFGYGGSIYNQFDINECHSAIKSYLENTLIRGGSYMYAIEGSMEDLFGTDKKMVEMYDETDYSLFALCMYDDTTKDKLAMVQGLKTKILEKYKKKQMSHRGDPLWRVLDVMEREGKWAWNDYGENDPFAKRTLFGMPAGMVKATSLYLEKRASEKFAVFDEYAEKGEFPYEDIRWIFMLARFWKDRPPSDNSKMDKLLLYLSVIVSKNRESMDADKEVDVYEKWIVDHESVLTEFEPIVTKNIRSFVAEWNEGDSPFKIVFPASSEKIRMSDSGGYILLVTGADGNKVGYISLLNDGEGGYLFYAKNSSSIKADNITMYKQFEKNEVIDKFKRLYLLTTVKRLIDASTKKQEKGAYFYKPNPKYNLNQFEIQVPATTQTSLNLTIWDVRNKRVHAVVVINPGDTIGKMTMVIPPVNKDGVYETSTQVERGIVFDDLISILKPNAGSLRIIHEPLYDEIERINSSLFGNGIRIEISDYEVTGDQRYIFGVYHNYERIGYMCFYTDPTGQLMVRHIIGENKEKLKSTLNIKKYSFSSDDEVKKRAGRMFNIFYYQKLFVSDSRHVDSQGIASIRILIDGKDSLDLLAVERSVDYDATELDIMRGDTLVCTIGINGSDFNFTYQKDDEVIFTNYKAFLETLTRELKK